jgi:hypothetical protein
MITCTDFETPSVQQIENMLSYVSPDCDRESWARIGMAIKSAHPIEGLEAFDNWSAGGSNYNKQDTRSTWRSINITGGVGIASLIYEAQQNGFKFDKKPRPLSPEETAKREFEADKRCVKQEKEAEIRKHKAKKSVAKIVSELSPDNQVLIRYLNNRGLYVDPIPEAIRFHPRLPYWQSCKLIDHFPAMLGLITDVNNNLVALHRTFLSPDGVKASVKYPKKITTPITTISGASVKLGQPDDVLFVCEGIETGLAVMLETKKPVWCCLSAGGLERVVIPESVKKVYIMADKDRSGVGEKSAKKLSYRLMAQGVTVHIVIPGEEIPAGEKGIDWLDVYNLEGAA